MTNWWEDMSDIKIIHVSDTHGYFKPFQKHDDCEVIVHSGDFFSNSHFIMDIPRYYLGQRRFQTEWLEDNIETLKRWLDGRVLLFTLGNHDFIESQEMELILNTNNIKALDLTNQLITFKNKSFYGFPYINYINGYWNFELHEEQMKDKFQSVIDLLDNKNIKLDCLVAHSPIYGVLDIEKDVNLGSFSIANGISYLLNNKPRFYLCGHIHKAEGTQELLIGEDSLFISNAACVYNKLII